jgi:hypothetical protein
MTDSPVRNGRRHRGLSATINLINEQHHMARFQFRATNTWVQSAHGPGSIKGFSAAARGTPGR